MPAPRNIPTGMKNKFDLVLKELKMSQRYLTARENLERSFFDAKTVMEEIWKKLQIEIRKYKCLNFRQTQMLNLEAVKKLPCIKTLVESSHETEERIFSALLSFQSNLKRQEEKRRRSFRFVNELRILFNEDTKTTFLSNRLRSTLLETVDIWVNGHTFKNTGIYHIRRFIGREITSTSDPLTETDRSLLHWSLLDDLIALLDKIFFSNLDFLPRIYDLGNLDLEALVSYLRATMIPYSGPFRYENFNTESKDSTVIALEISSLDALDTKMNGGYPLFGIFTFKINHASQSEADLARIANYPEVPKYFGFRQTNLFETDSKNKDDKRCRRHSSSF